MATIKEIENFTDQILPEIIELRQKIHSNPEIAGLEFDTASLIRNKLSSTAVELLPPFLKTDVVGILNRGGKKNVTLRADIDALPLDELNDLPYKSRKPGLMHACGHDGHTAMLIGTALVLDKMKEGLNGSVRFVFQPGEEVVAMGKDLIEAGALKNPEPDAVFAIHGAVGGKTGSIITRENVIMAAAGFFKIKITGKGGHGSRPENTIDPILTGCRAVEALQSIVSRNLDPQDAAVISVCRFEGGKNSNVIPEHVELEGTVRFLNEKVGNKIQELLKRTLEGVCMTAGASYEFEYTQPYIPTVNNSYYVNLSKKVTDEYLGKNMWLELRKPSMGGEDFSYYLKAYPGVYCNIGLGFDKPNLHNPRFNFNDDAIRNGIIFFVGMTLETLNNKETN